jgi:DNA-binding Lrp family transcriptional regulator
MRLTLDLAFKHLKCEPWRKVPDSTISTLDQIFDYWLPPILPPVIREDFLEFFQNKLAGRLNWLRSCLDPSFTEFKVRFDWGPGGYRGLPDFVDWDGKLDGQFLDHIIPLLQSIAKCTTTPLTVEQFWILATELCKFSSFQLKSLDIRIIQTLSQMPTMTIPEVSRLLRVGEKKVRRRWKRLQRLNICKIIAKIYYPSLGLIPVFVELFDTKSLIRSPYLISRIELSGNARSTLNFMVIPEEHLGSFAKTLNAYFGTAHSLFLAKDLGKTVAFSHYQVNAGRWNIDWRKLFIGAHLFHPTSSDSESYSPTNDSQALPRLYIPDLKDKQIIPILTVDARVKLEKLAKSARISVAQASRRKTRLMELGVIQLHPMLRRVGLIEDVFIRISERDKRLMGIIDELPQAWIRELTGYHTGQKEALLYATLPAGSYALMRYYLTKYLHTQAKLSLAGPEIGGWPLSFDSFDFERDRWTWHEPTIVQEEAFTAFEMKSQTKESWKEQLHSEGF